MPHTSGTHPANAAANGAPHSGYSAPTFSASIAQNPSNSGLTSAGYTSTACGSQGYGKGGHREWDRIGDGRSRDDFAAKGGKGYGGKWGSTKGGWQPDTGKGFGKAYGKGLGKPKGGHDRDEVKWEEPRVWEHHGDAKLEKPVEQPGARKRSASPSHGRGRNFEAKRDIKISTHLVTRLNRQYLEIKQRYKDLHISSDFTNAIASWTLHKELNHQQMMRNPPHFVLDSKFVIPVPVQLPSSLDPSGTKHSAKVVLLTVDSDPAQHLTFQLRFLACKVEKGLVCPGGAWNIADGADPYDDAVLRNTAIRTVKAMCGFDLSMCTKWVKFIEIWYHRPDEGPGLPELKERVVIFLPDCWNNPGLHFDVHCQLKGLTAKAVQSQALNELGEPAVVPCLTTASVAPATSLEDNAGASSIHLPEPDSALASANHVTQKGDTAPSAPAGVPESQWLIKADEHSRKKNIACKPITISLDGLLDYDVDDIYEKTAEVSLFAEAFHEMLQRDFGQAIFKFLMAKKIRDSHNREAAVAKHGAAEELDRETKRRRLHKAAEDEKSRGRLAIAKQEADTRSGIPKFAQEECPKESNSTNFDAPNPDPKNPEIDEDTDTLDVPAAVPAVTSGEDLVCQDKTVAEKDGADDDSFAKLRADAKEGFKFFDKAECGYLHASDVEMILYNLGAELPRWIVHGTVNSLKDSKDCIDHVLLCTT